MDNKALQLKKLGFLDSEVEVYLEMVNGSTTARDIMKKLKMKRPTVYYVLNSLEKRGLISKSGKKNDSSFIIAPFERLLSMAKDRENEAALLVEGIGEVISEFKEKKVSSSEKVKVSFVEGVDAVKHVVMDVLYSRGKHVDIVAPKHTFFWDFGEDFLRSFIEERRKRNIKTFDLWEVEISQDNFKKYYSDLAEVRILPKGMHGKFKTTIFLFDDKTLYVSSYKNCYAIEVVSKEHFEAMKAFFDGVWSISSPHRK